MSDKTPERIALEEKALALGLAFQVNMKDETLAAKIAEAEEAAAKTSAEGTKTGKPAKSKKATRAVDVLEVVGPKEGFRRAGFSFGAEPVLIPRDDISRAQAEAIIREPRLVVAEKTVKVDPE